MKIFDVQELYAEEMVLTEGGWLKWALQLLVEDIFSNPQDYVSPNAHTTPYGHIGGARP